MKVWETELTAGAVRNRNIKLEGGPFFLAPYTGGARESEAPTKRLSVQFKNGPRVPMWVYGDKKILTPRVGPVGEFFAANSVREDRPVRIKITQPALGELSVEKVS